MNHFGRVLLALALTSVGAPACVHREEQKPERVEHVRAEPTRSLPLTPTPIAPLFRDSICLNVKFTQGQPLSELPMLSDLGVRWVRDTVDWPTLEPAPGKFVDFPPAFQQRLEYYRSHDIGVVFLLAYGNGLAYAPTDAEPLRPIDPAAFGRYALAVAQGLRRASVRFVLEIWNEPHNFQIRKMVTGSWNGAPPAPWVDHYLKMADAAVREVKGWDPSVRLLSDDDMWIIHYWYLERGLPKAIDGFGFHPYTRNWPERAAVDQRTDWLKPFIVVDEDGSFQSAVRRLREQGERKLGKEPEMWATEWGWGLGQDSSRGSVSEDMLVGYLPRAYVSAAAARVKALCWFSARDSVDGPMGLVTNEGSRRKTYFAFKTMARELGDAALTKHVWGSEHLTRGVQAFVFQAPNGSRVAIWNADGEAPRLWLRGPLAGAKVVDALGEVVEPSVDGAGAAYVRLGGAPLYLRLRGSAELGPVQALVDAAKAE